MRTGSAAARTSRLPRDIEPVGLWLSQRAAGRGRALVFVDFEYFGWDDPAKTIVDFLQHPAMDMTDAQRRAFAAGTLAVFADVAWRGARAMVYPWFG